MGLAAGFTFLWSQSSKSWDAELCNYNILISMGGTELTLHIQEQQICSRAAAKLGVRDGISHLDRPNASP